MDVELTLMLGVIITVLGGAVISAGASNKRMSAAVDAAAHAAKTSSEALTTQTQTNIALNNELQEAIKDRRVGEHDRSELRAQITELTTEFKRVEGDFATYQNQSRQLINELQAELANVKRALAAAQQEAVAMQDSIRALTKAITDAAERERALKAALQEAKERIAVLEREGIAKEEQIKALTARVNFLETQLKEAQAARQQLEREKAALEAQIAALTAVTDEPEPTEEEPSEGV